MKLCLLVLFCAALPASAIAQAAAADLPKAPEPVESILRLQLFLDSKLFGPGKVDGRPGEFTTKALKRYQKANGMPETEIDAHSLDLSSIAELYTTYAIRAEDLKFIGSLPGKPSLQSKKKYLPYDSVLEFLTERFHTSPELIEYLNRPMKMSALKPGDSVKVPNVVEPFQIELLEPVPGLPEVPEFASRVIKIDTKEKLLGLHEGEKRVELRRAHLELLRVAHRPEQPRRDHVDRPQQARHRHPRHESAADHRPQRQPRLHAHRELGRDPPLQDDHQGPARHH